MRGNEFLDKMELIDPAYVEAADIEPKRKKNTWVKWGAVAACLCLVIGGVLLYLKLNQGIEPDTGLGVGGEPGGAFPDGVDPIIASLAVFPASESITDVENATIETVTEADAYEMGILGEYLPASLPGSYHFGTASLYETTMKNGTKYHLLRVTYTTGNWTAAQGEEETAPDPNTFGDSFVVFVMNFKPKTGKQIYQPADITESQLNEIGGFTFHISYGNIYVGISPDTAAPGDILAAVNSIK